MTTNNIGLFQAMKANMGYLQERQKVISQNIANANTPGYHPSDMSKVNFDSVLQNVIKDRGVKKVTLEATSAGHLSPSAHLQSRAKEQKVTYEVKPDENGVVLEEQMIKANDVQMNYNMMLNLYSSNMDMLRTSIGRKS